MGKIKKHTATYNKVLYNILKSRDERTVWNRDELYKLVNAQLPSLLKLRSCQFARIFKEKLKYKVFVKTQYDKAREYIFIKKNTGDDANVK